MHVLMLGWEFPPFITGGLGTACHGLTKAMDRRGMRVTFVLPKAVGTDHPRHVSIVGPDNADIPPDVRAALTDPSGRTPLPDTAGIFERTRFIGVEAGG